MVQKLPPPPQFASPELQPFNRWLVELTAVLANSGGINPDVINGFTQLQQQVSTNTDDITALQNTSASLQAAVTGLLNSVATLSSTVTTLAARAQVFNGIGAPAAGLGSVNDWYYDRAGVAPNRLFIKTGVATWTAQL